MRFTLVQDADQQKKDWFDSWWYVSPKTRRIETGIGKAMDAMEAKYKVNAEREE